MGEVIEDRGLIGHERVHYYSVRLPVGEPDDLMILEYPAEELELIPGQGAEARPDK